MSLSKQEFLKQLETSFLMPFPQDTQIQATKFINLLFERVTKECVDSVSLEEWRGLLTKSWRLFQSGPGKNGHFTITSNALIIHTQDMPFIVDSFKTFLKKLGVNIRWLLYPIVNVKRTGGKIEIHKFNEDPINQQFESFIICLFEGTLPQKSSFEKALSLLLKQIQITASAGHSIRSLLSLIVKKASQQKEKDKQALDLVQYLEWLQEDNFIFLGYRYFPVQYNAADNFFCINDTKAKKQSGLFLDELYDEDENLTPSFLKPSASLPLLENLRCQGLFHLKTSVESPIHRASLLESFEILDKEEKNGKTIINGVYQLIGLFSKESYHKSLFELPCLVAKCEKVLDSLGLNAQWYDAKIAKTILQSIPHDFLLHISEEELSDLIFNVMNLVNDEKSVIYVFQDPYRHYLNILLFLPKHRLSLGFEESVKSFLLRTFGGHISALHSFSGEEFFARFILTLKTPKRSLEDLSDGLLGLSRQIQPLTWTWDEKFLNCLKKCNKDSLDTVVFSKSYQHMFSPHEAVVDYEKIVELTKIKGNIKCHFYEDKESEAGYCQVKIFYEESNPVTLTSVLPFLHDLGFTAFSETTFEATYQDRDIFIHDFRLAFDSNVNWEKSQDLLQKALESLILFNFESDGLNRLILLQSLCLEEVELLRSFVKYAIQLRSKLSQSQIIQAVAMNPGIAKIFCDLFKIKFCLESSNQREKTFYLLEKKLSDALDRVELLEHDHALRLLMKIFHAVTRSNFFQPNRGALAHKFDPSLLDFLKTKKAFSEIFVYSDKIEGIHLRSSKIARGGIRLSDRYDDFREETFSLMKAQTIKNAVIVPTGAKGGFVVKGLDRTTDLQARKKMVVEGYQAFIHALLSITDNYDSEGRIVKPNHTVCFDQDDPYLVVAADKGTATFSDIANQISKDRGFWLDDAFASGGSDGYNHKEMGITAKGAWESIKHHFKKNGIDPLLQPISVIGVGDMAGDVFGNAMLQSQTILLKAAFNHQHIFLDPNPNPQESFEERNRLFQKSGSTWEDYCITKISPGGGVFRRTDKIIPLSPYLKNWLRIEQDVIEPDELIKKILQSQVDLLFFGGIGTFVKAGIEKHSDVQDKTNDEIRIDGRQLKAKVIVEGANLGMTQAARIEYAMLGGIINMDAFDNVAGVNCSDYEVNIKILLSHLKNPITPKRRKEILRDVSSEVVERILNEVASQNKALDSLQSTTDKEKTINILAKLTELVLLDRDIQNLPSDDLLHLRKVQGVLTRPEWCVVLSHIKMAFKKILLKSLSVDKQLHPFLWDYFPKYIQKTFKKDILTHLLHQEIAVTHFVNTLVDQTSLCDLLTFLENGEIFASDICRDSFICNDLKGNRTRKT